MIHTHTMAQIKTVQEPLRLLKTSVTPASTDNLNVVINTTPFTLNIPQTDLPVNTSSCIVVPNSTLSYLKLIPVVKSTVTSPNIKVTGWTRVVNSAGAITAWVPLCLFASASMTIGSDAITVNADGGFRRIVTITKAQGDAKIYNATNVNDTAFILVDTLGCELIEVEFNGGTAVTNGANAYYGAI